MAGMSSRLRKRKEASSSSSRQVKRSKFRERTWESIGLCPEILEQIFKHVDFERLKAFRLVCMDWNQEICRSYPGITRVVEYDHAVGNLVYWLDLRKRLELPKFIKGVQVAPDSLLFPPRLWRVTELISHVPITKLTILQNKSEIPPKVTKYVMKLLLLCSDSLRFLKTQFWSVEEDCPELKLKKLPRLQSLELYHRLEFDVPINVRLTVELRFFKTIISVSPGLKRLKLSQIPSIPQLLLTPNLLRTVEELQLIDRGQPGNPNIWRGLQFVQIQNLKKLSLDLGESEAGQCKAVLARFSDTLHQLKITEENILDVPACPQLTHLKLADFHAESQLLCSYDVPVLQSLKFFGFAVTGSILCPFPHVVNVGFASLYDLNYARYIEYTAQEQQTIFSQWFRLFPNATSWSVPYEYLQAFIQAVSANGNGIKVERLSVYLADMCPGRGGMRKIKEASDADKETFSNLHLLPGLKELQLHNLDMKRKVQSVHVKAIDFQNLPNLKTLHHYGGKLRRYTDLREHFQPLDRVEVIYDYSSRKQYMKDLELLNEIPNLSFALKYLKPLV